MDKPISLVRKETVIKLTKVIEESGLPLLVLEPIIKDLYMQIQQAMIQQTIAEEEEYNKSLTEVKVEETDK